VKHDIVWMFVEEEICSQKLKKNANINEPFLSIFLGYIQHCRH